jgi:hypothetical protein
MGKPISAFALLTGLLAAGVVAAGFWLALSSPASSLALLSPLDRRFEPANLPATPSSSPLPATFLQDGVTLNYDAPPFVPLKSCPVVFMYTTAQGGLGHRMTGLAIALFLAQRARAAIIIDRSLMYYNGRSVGGGESYLFAEALFNLGRFASMDSVGRADDPVKNTPWGVLRGGKLTNAFEIVAKAERGEACGEAFEMATGGGACDGDWCMSSDKLGGAYRVAQSILAPLYADGNYSRRPLTAYEDAYTARPRPLTVAWHIRNGDLKPHDNGGFFSALLGSINKGLNGLPAKHYVMSEHPITKDSAWGFHFLPDFPGFSYKDLSGLSVESAEHHLIGADVLVHYGASSFSYTATLASPMSQVKLYVVPKEVSWLNKPGAYWTHLVNGSVPVHEGSGAVLPEHEAELAALLRARYELITGKASV